jgi:hypothetical protein
MKSFTQRRTFSICVTVLTAIIVLAVYTIGSGTLRQHGFLSGWILLALIVFLALYNVRKALPFLPLGSSASWLQFHIYCGFLTFLMFAIHVRFAVPNGVFECSLALIYLSVFLSGIIGLYMSRTYPRRLTDLGNEVIFEHIPVVRRQLQDQIESLLLKCNSEAATSALAEFYKDRIRPFIVGQHDVVSHLIRGSSWRYRSLVRAIADQNRYLNDDERQVLTEVESLVSRKHQVDTQYALQGALKMWLFFHIPATYALLIFAVFHSVLVHAWSGGVS